MRYFSLLLVCFLSFNLSAQTDNKDLDTQLETMKTAFMEKDYATFVDFTYPKVIEMMGGKEKMVETTSASIAKMESQNFIISSIAFKDPSELMEHNGDLQCAITQVLVMDTPNGKVQSERALIAISKDNGKNWVFLDSSGMPRASLENFYENLHPDLNLDRGVKKKLN
jgi:hypothetical protein